MNAVSKPLTTTDDVAITPNGSIAVVSHRNWVHFFTTTTGRSLGSDNVGTDLIAFNSIQFDWCSPDLAVDSVEVTNTRAVVITTKGDPVNSPAGATTIMVAYVYDLTTSPVTRIARLHVGNHQDAFDLKLVAHDLAITPDGMKAVVSGNFVSGMIDLSISPPTLLHRIDGNESRGYPVPVDSVEVTNSRAVLISSHAVPGASRQWKLGIFELGNYALVGNGGQPYIDAPGSLQEDAHDVVITPNGKYACMRAGASIIVISGIEVDPSAASVVSTSGDPVNSPLASVRTFASDSIVATNFMLVSIGTEIFTTFDQARVDFVGLTGSVPQPFASQVITSGPFTSVRASDVGFIPDGTRVVVRCADNAPVGAGGVGKDFQFFACTGTIGAPIAQFGASDNDFGVDGLEIGTSSLIGISEARNDGFPPVGFNNGSGHVQIIRLQ